MELYRIGSSDMTRIENSELDKEAQLEDRLVRSEAAQIGGTNILYCARQGVVDSGGQFDIIGVDERGDLVIVELKRGSPPRDVISQAIEYASELQHKSYHQLNKRYKQFLKEEQNHGNESTSSLQEAHAEYFELENPLSANNFNSEQRIVIVGSQFDDNVLLKMTNFLRAHEIDVILVRYDTYRDNELGTELLSTQAIQQPLRHKRSPTEDSNISKPWKDDGRVWHLEEQTNPSTAEFLESVINELTNITNLSEPEWGQRYYIGFSGKDNERLFTISTRATLFKIRFNNITLSPEGRSKLAESLSVPKEDVDLKTFSSGKEGLRIKCKPNESLEPAKLAEEVSQLLPNDYSY